MTIPEAIKRLQVRDEYLATKIEQRTIEGGPTFWFTKDREALAIAIQCCEYTQAMQDYEASQVPR